jgi:hypothetical protein
MKKDKQHLTEIFSMRLTKEEKVMLKILKEKYYFDVFGFIRNTIRLEYNKKINNKEK